MSLLRPHLGPYSGSALGLLLLIPVALFISASVLKYTIGVPDLYDGLGFLADPQRLPWYDRASPFLFLGGPLAAALLSLRAVVKLDIRRENDQVITTVTLVPRRFNLVVAAMSLGLLAILGGYIVAENLGHS